MTQNLVPELRTMQNPTMFETAMMSQMQPQRFAMNSQSPERGPGSPQSPHSSVMMSPSRANFEQFQEAIQSQPGTPSSRISEHDHVG